MELKKSSRRGRRRKMIANLAEVKDRLKSPDGASGDLLIGQRSFWPYWARAKSQTG
jgi:hypothetical protein